MSRWILRHGFAVLLLAFFIGFGIIAGGPRARGWMAAHVAAMISALIIIAVGLVWDRLRLSERQRTVLRWSAVFNGYWGILGGAFATLFAIPGPATGGGAQPTGTPAVVFFTVFIPLLTILPFVFTSLVLYGLRGEAE